MLDLLSRQSLSPCGLCEMALRVLLGLCLSAICKKGNGTGNGMGNGTRNGMGNGTGNRAGNGMGNGTGNGMGSGTGNGTGNGSF